MSRSLLTSPQVAAVAAAGGIAVQPIGATEQHGPHLPVTTDAVIATALAERAVDVLAARQEQAPPAWLLPTLAYGKSPEHAGSPATNPLSPSTLRAVCRALARSVAEAANRTLVFVNAHGGNPEALQLVARDIREETGVLAVPVHAPSLPLSDALAARMPAPELDVHAGFYETSVMLALAPDAVDLSAAHADGIDRAAELAADAVSPLVGLFRAEPLPWHARDVSVSGTIGDPTGADAAWGAVAIAKQAESLADVFTEIARLRGELA